MKRFIITSIIAIVLAWFTVWFFSEDVAQEKKMIREVDFTARFNKMQPLANKGDHKAQFIIGELLRQGKGVDQDQMAAARWHTKAANKGYAPSQYVLGTMYEKGNGVPQDVFKAVEWYKLAAGLGRNANAMFAMGQLYFKGSGVPHDYAEALTWYQKAANRGHGAAQFLVGSMYQDGWSVKSNYIEAYKWYTLAIANAKQALGVNAKYDPLKVRTKLTKRMNKFQIQQGKKKVNEWHQKHR